MNMSSLNPEEIRSHREMWMMSREELAERVGVPVSAVVEWEEGVTPIPAGRVDMVRKALGVEGTRAEFGQDALMARLGFLAKQRREEIGLGRVPFSKEAGLGSDKTVADFEFGRRILSGTSQRKVEKALGWRLGAIDDVLRMTDRKASSILMEELDAEDSLHLAAQRGLGLALVSNEDLIAELQRRLGVAKPARNQDAQNLYGLAASTNSEHLEEEQK